MGRETVLFKNEEKKSLADACALLRTLADRIESGSLTLANAAGQVALSLPGEVTVEIKVEEETKHRTKRSLEIELEWVEGEEARGQGPSQGLTIS